MTPSRVRLDRLALTEFRVYRQLEMSIPAAGLRVVGPNGSGKTSLVEALLLLSTTRSRRSVLDADLIHHESGKDIASLPFCRVVGAIASESFQARLDIYIEKSERNHTRKIIRVGDAARRATDVVGLFPTVSFSPDDLDLIVGSPSIRRRFLDVLLSQIDREYMRHLSRYSRMVSQRNSLLKAISAGTSSRDELPFWDDQIVGLGSYVLAARATAVRLVSNRAAERFNDLAAFDGNFRLSYDSTLRQPGEWWRAIADSANDLRSVAQRVGVVFEAKLREAVREDVARGMTTIGPHRDDLDMTLDGLPIQRFGSRGQQRLAVVALKLAEIAYMTATTGARPTFILDDVLSELDAAHRRHLLDEVVHSGCQSFVTSTDATAIQHPALDALGVATLESPGRLVIESS